MHKKTDAEFRRDLEKFDTCMLVTRDGTHLRSRPMRPDFSALDGSIRFLTSLKTHKVDEVEAEPQANLVFAAPDETFISVSGPIRLSTDLADIDALWSPATSPWFIDGKAEAVVLILEPEIAEYWDTSKHRLQAGWELLKGVVTGERPEPGQHGTVSIEPRGDASTR